MAAGPGRGSLGILAVAAFVSSYDRFAMAPLLLMIAAGLGASPGEVAAVAGGYYLAYGFAQPLWGMLADARGRVAAMRWGLAGGAVAGLASAAAPDLESLAVARGLAGGCFSAVIPCVLVYVGDCWPAHLRQRPLSDVLGATALGTTGGTLGTGAVAQVAGWRAGLAVPAVAAAALWVATRRLPEPERPGSDARPGGKADPTPGALQGLRRVLASGWARVLIVLTFAEGVVVVAAVPYLAAALQAEGRSVSVAGAAAGAFGIGVLAGSQGVKRLVGRVTPARLIGVGGGGIAAGWAVLLPGITVPAVTVAAFVVGAGWAFLHSSMQTWATDVVPAARATAVSLFVAALFAGAACGAVATAPLVDQEAFDNLFKIAFVLVGPLTVAIAAARARYARA